MTRLLKATKGTTKTIVFTVTDENGTAINITGYTVYFTVKKNADDPDSRAIISESWTSHTTPASGITTLILTPSDTNKASGTYFWDLKTKDGSGNLSVPMAGSFIISPNITITA